MNNFIKLILILLTGIIISCDKIKEPYMAENSYVVDTTKCVRKVLIEDFTGHKCINCPEAQRTIEELINSYPDRIISIAIHSGYYSIPNSSGDKYTYDFRTKPGNFLAGNGETGDLNGFYDINKNPYGSINSLAKDSLCEYGYWTGKVSYINDTLPEIKISIDNDYVLATRILNTTIEAEILIDIDKTLNLIVYLTEDSIINWQKDQEAEPSDDVENYVHMHVLRDDITGYLKKLYWGDEISTGSISEGEIIIKEYNYTLDATWVAKNCSVVAFIYDADTKEVLQVEKEHVLSN
jgi:hypothetical protein